MDTAASIIVPFDDNPPRKCTLCGRDFEPPPFKIAAQFVKVCPVCSEAQAEADQTEARDRAGLYLQESWNRFCPPAYRDTEPHRLPSPSKLDTILKWAYGPKGLILHGNTGKGKSRCAYLLLKREFMARRTVAVLDCGFAYDYGARFSTSPGEAAGWLDAKMKAQLLLLDDVLKVKLTDSCEQALFAILNYRSEWRLPTIITTNDTGESLLARMSQDRGAAMLRRMREFSESISF